MKCLFQCFQCEKRPQESVKTSTRGKSLVNDRWGEVTRWLGLSSLFIHHHLLLQHFLATVQSLNKRTDIKILFKALWILCKSPIQRDSSHTVRNVTKNKTYSSLWNCADLSSCRHYVWWSMVAGTGVPMKVDTGLFTAQPTERDPTGGPRTEYKAWCITYRHQEKGHVRLCHTAKCTMGFYHWEYWGYIFG